MASKISTCFLGHGLSGLSQKRSNVRITTSPSYRMLPAPWQMRQRTFSSHSKRQYTKKVVPPRKQPTVIVNGDSSENASTINVSVRKQGIISKSTVDVSNDSREVDVDNAGSGILAMLQKNLVSTDASAQQLSTAQLEDLVAMISNVEKNIRLLNQARISATNDLQTIFSEKEQLQGKINSMEMKLAETDAWIRDTAQDKVHVNLLEEQVEKLRNELIHKGGSDRIEPHIYSNQYYQLNEELRSLRDENDSLKTDVQKLMSELNTVKNADERVMILEKERSDLESNLKNLESRFSDSRKDISNLSSLKFDYKVLGERVENLQMSLDKATTQANQAIEDMQRNQELRKKVNKLEESLEEVNVYKLSSERLQQHMESNQEKISLLEDQLQRSDDDMHSFLQLYHESLKEFQDTLDTLKEESKRRSTDKEVAVMPGEFWSSLVLMIDGWFLEKKISSDDASLLRDLVLKRDGRICNAYIACKEKKQHDTMSTFLKLISRTPARLHVIHIAAEMAPVAKVGGLGDVVTGLSKALQKKGHLVEIVLPKYDCMEYDRICDLRALDCVAESYFNGTLFKNKVWVGTVEGLPVYFIETLHPDNFFRRGQYYGEHDDFRRFSYFSRAALDLLLQTGKKPDIIHCHDWQTAFVAPLYWDLYAPSGFNSARICFTCHNFEHQGTAPAAELAACGLDVQQQNRPDRMQDNSERDRVNPVKGAVVFSNIVTTVSPTYAVEVQTAEGGRGLHATLNLHSEKFSGILNGIDTDAWDPATDSFLEFQYNANDLQGKAENKKAMRRQLGLSNENPRQPLVGCVTRLVPQKGVHLIRHAIFRTLELGGQFVLLGSSPVQHIQREFEAIASKFSNHDSVRLIMKYDESLSHRIYAATDMFIVPSIFEPCGLTQMIAMRYGSVPIARKTGGLSDSVFDVDDYSIPLQSRNGFTFDRTDEQGLNSALDRAFNHFKKDIEWEKLVHKVMEMEFGWDSSASQYEDLYSSVCGQFKVGSAALRR